MPDGVGVGGIEILLVNGVIENVVLTLVIDETEVPDLPGWVDKIRGLEIEGYEGCCRSGSEDQKGQCQGEGQGYRALPIFWFPMSSLVHFRWVPWVSGLSHFLQMYIVTHPGNLAGC